MSMSTEYVIDRLDEATRVNRDAKQVCNDALCLARGRLASLQNDIVEKDAQIAKLQAEVNESRAELLDLKVREMVENDGMIVQDSSGNITIKCSLGSGEDRWIPCSERLPYNYADVLIQIEYSNKCRNDIRVGYHSMERKSWFMGDLAGAHKLIADGLVVAWQPLPEDYVEPEEKKEVEFEIGDFVLCVSKHGVKMNAIYLKEGEECYQVLEKESQRIQPLDKKYWKLTKYPGHMSVVDWLNGLPVS